MRKNEYVATAASRAPAVAAGRAERYRSMPFAGRPEPAATDPRSGAAATLEPPQQLSRDAHRPGRLARDCDPAGVAPEGGDVLLHPAQGGDLVEQAEVGDAVVEEQEAVDPKAIVDGHADDAVSREARAVVARHRTRAVDEGAAVNPDQDRQAGRADVGRPDVEVQALLAGDHRLGEDGRER